MNSIIQDNNQITVSNDNNTVTIINYLWYNAPYEVLYLTDESNFTYDLIKDGVYEIYQITIPYNSLYRLSDNKLILKSTGDVIIDFLSNVTDKSKIEKFINDEKAVSKNIINYTELKNCYQKLLLEALNAKISGACKIDDTLNNKIDILYMSLTAIQYFIELDTIYEIQRIIESIMDQSCGICKTNNHINKCNCK